MSAHAHVERDLVDKIWQDSLRGNKRKRKDVEKPCLLKTEAYLNLQKQSAVSIENLTTGGHGDCKGFCDCIYTVTALKDLRKPGS